MKRSSAALAVLLLACPGAHAEITLSLRETTAVAGGTVVLGALMTPEATQPTVLDPPAEIPVQLVGGGRERPARLIARNAPGAPAGGQIPGAFLRLEYVLELPPDLSGTIAIRPERGLANPLLVQIEALPPSATPLAEQPGVPEQARPIAPREMDQQEAAARFAAISAHEPMYFSAGSSGKTNAKFQLSFKYRLNQPDTPGDKDRSFFNNLYVGYTQTSIWDLEEESKPFFDSSYRPALFYHHGALAGAPDQRFTLGLQTGLEHESNGRGGDQSRSINIAYVRPILRFGPLDDFHLTVAPKIYGYLDREENGDIADYRGFVDLAVRYGKWDSWQIATLMRKGKRSDAGSVQIDFTNPWRVLDIGNLNGYLHLQYFYGWGESLLDYNRYQRPQFRIGVMVVR